jgi:PAS domain S-box-containing protein
MACPAFGLPGCEISEHRQDWRRQTVMKSFGQSDDDHKRAADERGARLKVLAVQENQEDRARLAAIVESSDDAIIGKTLEGIITSWNDGARRVFGYTAEEMVGQPVSRLIPADRLDEEPDILARLQRGERVKHFETVRQHSIKTEAWSKCR